MSKPEYPEYTEDAVLGNKGRRLVENIVHDSFGWLFREVAKDDLGIDGIVEVLHDDRMSRGRLFAVQIKCGPSYLAETTADGYVYRGKLKHLKYWTEFSLPVVLVLCNPDTGVCYWVQITPANIEQTGVGWKIIVPFGQTLASDAKWRIESVVRTPQPDYLIPLALYRVLVEKFPKIKIAQSFEMPRDFWGFEFLAELEGDYVLITHLYKPIDTFEPSDIDDVIQRRVICSKGCGWDLINRWPKIVLFFVAHTIEQLQLTPELLTHLATFPFITHYRAICKFSYAVSLNEIDNDDQYIDMYDHR